MNKQAIKSVLSAIPTGDFLQKSKDLLATIGYRSERTLERIGTVHDFFEEFPPLNPNTKTEQEFRKHAESVKLVFQFTSDEITDDIQEKRLVTDALFNKAQIQDLLKEEDFDNGDAYYRAVLQNLFFATLNTEIDERKFSKENYSGNRNFSRYRYKKQMRDPDKLLEFFAKTPFINGGLFDCLDTFEAPKDGGYRIDCFSDVDYIKLSIPNRLFFDAQQGLIPLLEHYKFTVEENIPIEQEVALDPELLGRVFENLLAAYNPETGATVRKQTGSYYTPRARVI